MEKKTQQINVHITFSIREELVKICQYEGVDMSELVRGWIREKVREYRKDKRFLAKVQEEEVTAVGH